VAMLQRTSRRHGLCPQALGADAGHREGCCLKVLE
jgi:hypothetical protein